MAKTLLQHVIEMMEIIAPIQLADTSFDNVGTLVEAPPRANHANVMVCIDLTSEVLDEALEMGNVGVIITYRGFASSTI